MLLIWNELWRWWQLKNLGDQKKQFLYHYLDEQKNWTRNSASFEPAVTEELFLDSLHEREATHVYFI